MANNNIHQWIYTMVPIGMRNTTQQWIAFMAYCKACRTYFTERMAFDEEHGVGKVSLSTLPRYGCEAISDDVKF